MNQRRRQFWRAIRRVLARPQDPYEARLPNGRPVRSLIRVVRPPWALRHRDESPTPGEPKPSWTDIGERLKF